MKRQGLDQLPLYPEERMCTRPTTEQILRLFAPTERHILFREGRRIETFHPKLTENVRASERSPAGKAPIVCERFRVVCKEPLARV